MPILSKFFNKLEVVINTDNALARLAHVPRENWFQELSQTRLRHENGDGTGLPDDEMTNWVLKVLSDEKDQRDYNRQILFLLLWSLPALALISYLGFGLYQKRAKKAAHDKRLSHIRHTQSQSLAREEPQLSKLITPRPQPLHEGELDEVSAVDEDDEINIKTDISAPSFTKHSHRMTTGKSNNKGEIKSRKSLSVLSDKVAPPLASSSSSSTSDSNFTINIKVNSILIEFLLATLKDNHYLPGNHSYQGYPRTLFTMFWPNNNYIDNNVLEKVNKFARKGDSGVILYSPVERDKYGYDAKLKLLGANGKGDTRYLGRLYKAIGFEKQYGVLLFNAEETKTHNSLHRMNNK